MRSSLERLSVPLFNVKGKGDDDEGGDVTAQESRQRTVGWLVLPTHVVWPVTVERLLRCNSH